MNGASGETKNTLEKTDLDCEKCKYWNIISNFSEVLCWAQHRKKISTA